MALTKTIARPISARAFLTVLAILIVVAGVTTAPWWLPPMWERLNALISMDSSHANSDHPPGASENDQHEHAHDESNTIALSRQARANIGLTIGEVSLSDFVRTISVPGTVVERPGRSMIEITALMTGVVTRIYPIQGQAVEAGEKLFELQLTHEELVQAQGEFLRTAEELDVIGREVARLETVTRDGAIAGKTLLERKYEQQKKQATLRAQREALLLHGLSEGQVENILSERSLLKRLTVIVPSPDEKPPGDSNRPIYRVQTLKVDKGQHVTAGETLAEIVDHALLFIEGNAFEQDAVEINRAVEEGWPVTAVFEGKEDKGRIVKDLKILYVAGKIEQDSRVFHFYVTLPNALLRDREVEDGHRFIFWRFQPGQRVELRIPVETWRDRIVLPAEAVAQDGAETFVFRANGATFERVPVHVEYHDGSSAVIANDGAVAPGEIVVHAAAQQLQLAIKNKTGPAVDPHAGHHH